MKKTLPIVTILTLAGLFSANAQFTVRVAGGYAWPGFMKSEGVMGPKIDPYTPATDALIPMANINYFNDSAKTYQPVHGSYGQGMNFTLGLGYLINPYFGVDLGISYLKSADISADQTFRLVMPDANFPDLPPAPTPYYMKSNITTKAYGVSLMPSIVVQGAKPGFKIYPYARVGISLPVAGGLTHTIKIDVQQEAFTNSYFAQVLASSPYYLGKHTDITLKTEGTVSVGANAAIGIAYKPLPFLSVFAEVNGQYLVTRAKSSKVTTWNVDGKDEIALRGAYRNQFNFVDKLDNTSNNADYNSKYDSTKPKDDIRPVGPFSNLGFNVGLTFILSKKTLKKEEKTP
jgi:hypothetical protein